ncbi:MAG: S1 RNA-binding domain-containing protein, partial [Candidatus Pacebacteria bacterium]|nr:S1 RNA-binding domain-containing protein [Candidatus Paceibacterota bacterium]
LVEIGPQKEGLVHVSEIAPFRINKVEDVLAEGEIVSVIIKELGDNGKISLSIKKIDPDFATKKGLKPSDNNTKDNEHFRNQRQSK